MIYILLLYVVNFKVNRWASKYINTNILNYGYICTGIYFI